MRKKKLIFIIVFALVIIVIFLLVNSKSVFNQGQTENSINKLSPSIAGGVSGQFLRVRPNNIYVADQKPGTKVYINFLDMSNSGFVIITNTKDYNEKDIIGLSSWLTKGDSSGLSISTTKNMLNGNNYYAWVVKDNGDGIFEPKQDKVVISKNNPRIPIMVQFKVSKDAKDPKNIRLNF